jgi:predicted small integral membrane protein
MLTMCLCWWGAIGLLRALGKPPDVFRDAKRIPMVALALGMLMWLVAFLSIGAEWFLMWQSPSWNGQQAAFRMFVTIAVVFLIVIQPEDENQPRVSRPEMTPPAGARE